MWKTYKLGCLMVYFKANYKIESGAKLVHQLRSQCVEEPHCATLSRSDSPR
jgi:hypothetical protein